MLKRKDSTTEQPRRSSKRDKTRETEKTVPGHGWTQGDRIRTIVGGVALSGAILCAPVALGLQLLSPTHETAVAAVQSEPGLSAAQQAAGARAVEFVGAWLVATEESHAAFDGFGVPRPANFPSTSAVFSDLHLVSVLAEPKTPDDLVVTVGANIKESVDGAAVLQLRHFVVPVRVYEGKPLVVSLPSPISIPSGTEQKVSPDYGQQVQGPGFESVRLFVQAYLTGEGDINRMLTPGTSISPLSPAPYAKVTLTELRSIDAVSAEPADGETASVYALVDAAAPGVTGTGQPVSYTLELTARAGRWEITTINAFPNTGDVSTDTPSPTSETE